MEPVFADIRLDKDRSRFAPRGRVKVGTQWQLYGQAQDIEQIALPR